MSSRAGVALAEVFPPMMLAARCRASMSLWSVLIWACLVAMAAVISFMAEQYWRSWRGVNTLVRQVGRTSTTELGRQCPATTSQAGRTSWLLL